MYTLQAFGLICPITNIFIGRDPETRVVCSNKSTTPYSSLCCLSTEVSQLQAELTEPYHLTVVCLAGGGSDTWPLAA